MVVLGIDPGLAKGKPVGLAVVDLDAGRVLWWAKEKLPEGGPVGLRVVRNMILRAIRDYSVRAIIVEDARAPNVISAQSLGAVVLLSGVLALDYGLHWEKVNPTTWMVEMGVPRGVGAKERKRHVVRLCNMLLGCDMADREHDAASAALIAHVGGSELALRTGAHDLASG